MADPIERAARVLGQHMSRWDLAGRPDVEGGIDVQIASALHEAGLLAPAMLTEIQDHAWLEGWSACWDWPQGGMAHPEPTSPYSSEGEGRDEQ